MVTEDKAIDEEEEKKKAETVDKNVSVCSKLIADKCRNNNGNFRTKLELLVKICCASFCSPFSLRSSIFFTGLSFLTG